MHLTLPLIIALAFFKKAYTHDYVIDLEKDDYKKLCSGEIIEGEFYCCTIRFKVSDSMDLFEGDKLIWTSEPCFRMIQMSIMSKSGVVELVEVVYKNIEIDVENRSHFYKGDKEFRLITQDLFHELVSVIRYRGMTFDINLTVGDWFTALGEGNTFTYYIKPGVRVEKIVDDKDVVWGNSVNRHVPAIKMKYEPSGPTYIEVYYRGEDYETKIIYVKDDFGWHYVNRFQYKVSESKLEIPGPQRLRLNVIHEEDEDDHESTSCYFLETQRQSSSLTPVRKPILLASRKKTRGELSINMDDTKDAKIPEFVDVCDYRICGFDTRVYDAKWSTVKRVTEGDTLLWEKVDGWHLDKVTLYKMTTFDQLYVEIEYTATRSLKMTPIKGIKYKDCMNKFYQEYDYFVKTRGEWNGMRKIDFYTLREKFQKNYIVRSIDKEFDESFFNFFEEKEHKPPEKLNLKKRIETSGIRKFFSTLYKRIFVSYIPISYDLSNDPEYTFEVSSHRVYENFKLYELTIPYALVRIIEGDQIVWSQEESGIGAMKTYHFKGNGIKLLHLVIDGRRVRHRHFENRKDYWYSIEEEEYFDLLNFGLKTRKGMELVYSNDTYELVGDLNTSEDQISLLGTNQKEE